MATMTAAQKREKQLREQITIRLNSVLKSFENYHMQEVVDWNVKQVEKEAYKYPEFKTWNEMKAALIGKSRRELNIPNKYGVRRGENPLDGTVTSDDLYYTWIPVERARKRLEKGSLLLFEFMKEADEAYKRRFDNLIEKAMCVDFNVNRVDVKQVGSGTFSEFSILLTDGTTELHARVIFACGMIKAPHYRFITTTRKAN